MLKMLLKQIFYLGSRHNSKNDYLNIGDHNLLPLNVTKAIEAIELS